MQEKTQEKKSRKDEILSLLQDTTLNIQDLAEILGIEEDSKKVKSLRSQINRFERDGLLVRNEEGWTIA